MEARQDERNLAGQVAEQAAAELAGIAAKDERLSGCALLPRQDDVRRGER